ncbi:MAG TPA: DNA-directed RNA polymerase subunit alpha C-terminal domain-containing protein [Flavisolibacter sp.]|jgi:DNA-directed RNA polymerase alpha subunit|nr:DNA-directed RNA polymerase subunit alpha C-terminal domain-containing protein [Flavisolibacter sp.]
MEKKGSVLSQRQKWEFTYYTLDQCREAIELLQQRMDKIMNSKKGPLEIELSSLQLSVRSFNALTNNGFFTIGDIMIIGMDAIEKLRGCGPSTGREVREAIAKALGTSSSSAADKKLRGKNSG